MIYIAHTSQDGREQALKQHLESTAILASKFAAPFGGEAQANMAGWLHDIGKYSARMQKRLHGSDLRVDHSTAGAQLAVSLRQAEVAFAIAGHHAGLPDMGGSGDASSTSTLWGRKKRHVEPYDAWKTEISLPQSAQRPSEIPVNDHFASAFYIRMLFSCLVDADFLDTETFMDGAPKPRGEGYASMEELFDRFMRYFSAWEAPPSALNSRRNEIFQTCLCAGQTSKRGLYTLTVPTGGGKTLSSLAFALAMAKTQGLKHIIYVIPYTSIIDQNAAIFAQILGEENVLEHHSGVEYDLDENASPAQYRKALAAENWDAPIIVTTAVQFFESLYANRPARCRKLHNMADSVVIFDEAQTLPIPMLRPCTAAIAQLVRHFGATAVLCTATQPALGPLFAEVSPGLALQEMVPQSAMQDALFQRTTLHTLGEIAQDALVERMRQAHQVLCVVNRRASAQEIYQALPEEGAYCLTTLLCPAERKALFQEIRERLRLGLPCRVVSTSLVEAGVDVVFPQAYREIAGLDSILQTAGRCNRNGKRDASESPVYIFWLAGQKPPRLLERNIDATRRVLREYPDPTAPEAIERYFTFCRTLAGEAQLDSKQIYARLSAGSYAFASVAKDFALIEESGESLYIPLGAGAALVEQLRQGERSRSLFRKLGQYAVNVYPQQLKALSDAGCVEWLDEKVAVLCDLRAYDSRMGLTMEVGPGEAWFL